jgi:hypothetical protein
MFTGRGEKGVPVDIGIEHKTVSDVVQSLRNNRLGDVQLQAMRGSEDGSEPRFKYCWLVIEGDLIYDGQGGLQRRSGRNTYKPLGMTMTEMFKRLTTLHLCGGLNWLHFRTRHEVVMWVDAVYHAFTDKDLDKHKSHLGIYEGPQIGPQSLFRRVMRQLPGVGNTVAQAAEKKFISRVTSKPSIQRAVSASASEWAALETTDDKGKTRKFGPLKAEKLRESVK